MQNQQNSNYSNLKDAWQALSSGKERQYARDLAINLGTSEAELVGAGCGENVTHLKNSWGSIIAELDQLGEVKILTRNDHVVHEKVGIFGNISVRGPMGLVLNRDIDLRLFLNRWVYGFAVKTETTKGIRQSLQFFDDEGTAIHKIFLTENSDATAYDELVAKYKSDDITPDITVVEKQAPITPTPDDEINIASLRDNWAKMKDVHQFHALLKKHDCDRHQAFRLIGPDYAEKLSLSALREVLEHSAREKISIMVFVGNKGCIQIHTGVIESLKDMGPWINILDPKFNLHLREDHIAEAWLVRKPTKDGVITTLELFDKENTSFALLCGEREIRNPENPDWANLLENLNRHQSTSEAAE
ncbi:hemin-degrading factor [Kiloniella antarctica]|uniref:Hemin-degrading factor n=1 Tax=Kiloniella antarctica TaxID=1550907 RepID=A0ABW5BL89_9PROT